jgi:hypothetical protein
MAIPNEIGLVPYRTFLYVTNNIPGRMEWREIRGMDGDGHGAHEAPWPGHLFWSSENRNSESESRNLWLLTRVPL